MNQQGVSGNFHSRMQKLSMTAVALLALAIVFQFLWKTPATLLSESQYAQDLSGTWEVCLLPNSIKPVTENCEWQNAKVPSSIAVSKLPSTQGWALYRNRISIPEFCFNEDIGCNFIAGEIGDAVQVSINGTVVGRHGGFPPNDRYSRHLPVRMDISKSVLKAGSQNHIELSVRYLKKSQTGILRGPIAIVSGDSGAAITRTVLIQNVILPLVAALGIGLLSLLSLLMVLVNRVEDSRLRYLVAYGLAAMMFLVSYSSIPREYLSLAFTGCLHFMLRFVMDGAFFELAAEVTGLNRKVRSLVRVTYSVVISAFPMLYFLDLFSSTEKQHLTGFSGSVLLSSWVDYGLVAGPYLLAAFSALINRGGLSKPTRILFGVIGPLPLLGAFTFHGVVSLPHFVCFFPFFTVLVLSIEFWAEFFQSQARLVAEGKIGRMATQVAHDIQSPLAALVSFSKSSVHLPPEQKLLLQQATSRIQNIAGDLIDKHKALKRNETQISTLTTVVEAIHTIVAEKSAILGTSSAIRFQVNVAPTVYGVSIGLSSTEYARVLSNMLSNAIEAVKETSMPWVEIAANLDGDFVKISVDDNGEGIPKDVLPRIREDGGNYNKPGGAGLGIRHAKETLRKVGGKFQIDSISGQGTTITLFFPVLRTTNAFIPTQPAGMNETINLKN